MLGYAEHGAPPRQALISIVDHRRDAVNRYPAPRVLRLCFEDAEDADCGQKLITYEQAEAICRFVLRFRGEIDTLIVHCAAGVSRSPAVAAAIVKGLGENDEAIWNDPALPPQRTRVYGRSCRV